MQCNSDELDTVTGDSLGPGRRPYVEIVEEPASKALRFRYQCEGRSSSIPGENSTAERKTYPTIRVVGYQGPAIVVVSLVTNLPPHQPHPHNLVSYKEDRSCENGVCTMPIPASTMSISFDKLGIQCVKRVHACESLRVRQQLRIDPFGTGFDHAKQTSELDLNSVRMCFQVFTAGKTPGKFSRALRPVVSQAIYDKKAVADLVICRISHFSAPVDGGLEVILLCEKVAKDDIQVKLYEKRHGKVYWEDYGIFKYSQVHKQVAINFRVPKYSMPVLSRQPIQVYVQLRRPSDGAISNSVPFSYQPDPDDINFLKRKRERLTNSSSALISAQLQAEAENFTMSVETTPTFKVPAARVEKQRLENEQVDKASSRMSQLMSPELSGTRRDVDAVDRPGGSNQMVEEESLIDTVFDSVLRSTQMAPVENERVDAEPPALSSFLSASNIPPMLNQQVSSIPPLDNRLVDISRICDEVFKSDENVPVTSKSVMSWLDNDVPL